MSTASTSARSTSDWARAEAGRSRRARARPATRQKRQRRNMLTSRERPTVAPVWQLPSVTQPSSEPEVGSAAPGLDQVERRAEDAVRVELGGVEHQRIGGRPKGRRRAVGVPFVAPADVLQDGRELGPLAAGEQLQMPAPGSLLRSGRHEKFY